nr:interleukin-6 receptor subunit beta-like [Nerophis lumbriciformis]
MMSTRRIQLLVLAYLASVSYSSGMSERHLMVTPQSPFLQIGTNFTATCVIIDTNEATPEDLYWSFSQNIIPQNQYTKINESALSVTIPINNEKSEWLFCRRKRKDSDISYSENKFTQAILLTKLYPPEKPKNLTCIAIQEKNYLSKNLKCSWEAAKHNHKDKPTTYKIHVNISVNNHFYTKETLKNSAIVEMEFFPYHMEMEIWVVAHNELGSVESEHLKQDAISFAKTDPPLDVTAISETPLPSSLLIRWTHPIAEEYVKLKYEIRYCQNGSHIWTMVSMSSITEDITSFRLQKLQPDTVYITQVRCKHFMEGSGYWSNWSANVTQKTPEYRPTSKPRLWKIVTEGERINERQVTFICKNPVSSNGKINSFNIKIRTRNSGNTPWESILTNWSRADSSPSQNFIALKQIILPDTSPAVVNVTAINSMGESPVASLRIPEKGRELDPVKALEAYPQEGQLLVRWRPPNNTLVSVYVVEWVNANGIDWQRENKNTRQTTIKGHLEKFVGYNISVYPLYSGWTGKPTRVQAYLEEGAPLAGPSVRLNGKPGRNKAELMWNEIPPETRRGFITNYTIFYSSGTEQAITVPASVNSYVLTSLTANTKYDTWIRVSTSRGSYNGTSHSFTTLKYASGEIEMTVVGVCVGFLFVFLITMSLCIYKRDVIKRNFWPRIPNPRKSTIGNWSPDYHIKPETPKENCLSGISVLDMEVSDGKSVSEEDKASLALKKDKYLSEEHSSGIGGSSCMSSPRQSVSDSDEGADTADTTASTVQYSSVVASNGYKGQTPCVQPQQLIFSRSESTQPLLDSEENPDLLVQEGSRASQPFSQLPCFTHTAWDHGSGSFTESNEPEVEPQEVLSSLDMCLSGETTTDRQLFSSYMPQLGGYRPQ